MSVCTFASAFWSVPRASQQCAQDEAMQHILHFALCNENILALEILIDQHASTSQPALHADGATVSTSHLMTQWATCGQPAACLMSQFCQKH